MIPCELLSQAFHSLQEGPSQPVGDALIRRTCLTYWPTASPFCMKFVIVAFKDSKRRMKASHILWRSIATTAGLTSQVLQP